MGTARNKAADASEGTPVHAEAHDVEVGRKQNVWWQCHADVFLEGLAFHCLLEESVQHPHRPICEYAHGDRPQDGGSARWGPTAGGAHRGGHGPEEGVRERERDRSLAEPAHLPPLAPASTSYEGANTVTKNCPMSSPTISTSLSWRTAELELGWALHRVAQSTT